MQKLYELRQKLRERLVDAQERIVMPISHVYTLADLPARIIFVLVLYIILTRWTPLFRVQRSVLLTTSHIHSMILRVISSSSRFLPLAPYIYIDGGILAPGSNMNRTLMSDAGMGIGRAGQGEAPVLT